MTDRVKLLIGICIVLVFPFFMGWVILQQQPDDEQQTEQPQPSENHQENEKPIMWGVDSAYTVDESQYACVTDNYGKPAVWGRYLGDIENVSTSLDQDEVDFLHDKDIKILLIYNLIEDATGYDNGSQHAQEAIKATEQLDVPKGVAIFADIEPSFPVDASFIEGWQETIEDSVYEPGIYGVFNKNSDILQAFNKTATKKQENTIVWSAYPQQDPTTKQQAPDYSPDGPERAMVYGWQYAIETEQCIIDTNLFREKMNQYLW